MRYPAESRRQNDGDQSARRGAVIPIFAFIENALGGPQAANDDDFTGLAGDYAKFRAGYAPQVTTAILSYVGRDATSVDAADIGAGTGIRTRTLAARGLHCVVAVEPNDDMRGQGTRDLARQHGTKVRPKRLDCRTAQPILSACLVVPLGRFRQGVRRVPPHPAAGRRLRRLVESALVEANPLLVEIEAQITRLKPDIRRVSSAAPHHRAAGDLLARSRNSPRC